VTPAFPKAENKRKKKADRKPTLTPQAKIPGLQGIFDGNLLPTLNTSHSAGKCPEVGDRMGYFKGKIERVKVDLMVIEGDRDPQLKGNEAKRLSRIASPALEQSSITRGGRPAGYLRVTPGYNLPCQLLAQAVNTMGSDTESLGLCYWHALNYAREKGLKTVCFSLLGTNLNLKCTPETAAKIALLQVSFWLQGGLTGTVEKVLLCIHGPVNQKVVNVAIEEWKNAPGTGQEMSTS
jgi:O-acetyl-ADP-ribose deacetylase (regulator of RNase III)